MMFLWMFTLSKGLGTIFPKQLDPFKELLWKSQLNISDICLTTDTLVLTVPLSYHIFVDS